MALNRDWHSKHRMPVRATTAQRMAWHRAHAKHCGCRPIPAKVRAEMTGLAASRRRPAHNGKP